MKTDIYSQAGKKTGSIELPESVFGLSWNGDLVHQVITSMVSNARVAIAHTKGTSDVSGGGHKPWKQKGTGRARHGTRRSPIWKGGGVTFGPTKERNFTKKINKKMRTKALFTLLSEKFRDGEVLFVDAIDIKEMKTAQAKAVLTGLSGIKGFEGMHDKRKNAACFYLPERDAIIEKSFSNFGNVSIAPTMQINSLDIAKYRYIVLVNPKESVSFLESKLEASN